LIDSKIVLDAVAIGDSTDIRLRGLVATTGGAFFAPKSLLEAMVLFENETVLSLSERDVTKAPPRLSVCTGHGSSALGCE
jgi:hypothetical protein